MDSKEIQKNIEILEGIDSSLAKKHKDQLEYYLNQLLTKLPKENSLGTLNEDTVKKLLRELRKNDGEPNKKQDFRLISNNKRIIKLILELEIKDLETVKTIYNLSGHSFCYENKYLANIYDEVLLIFLKENLYNGPLEDTFGEEYIPVPDLDAKSTLFVSNDNELEDTYAINQIMKFFVSGSDEGINKKIKYLKQSNLEKYKILFIMFVREFLYVKKESFATNNMERFLEELLMELYFINPDAYDELYIECPSYEVFEEIYFEHYKHKQADKKIIDQRKFTNVIIVGLLFSVFKDKYKGKELFREIFKRTRKSFVLEILLDLVNYDDRIDESEFLNVYSEIFLNETTRENNNKSFIEYFTDVLINLKQMAIDNFEIIEDFEMLSDDDLKEIVTSFKEKNDFEILEKNKKRIVKKEKTKEKNKQKNIDS